VTDADAYSTQVRRSPVELLWRVGRVVVGVLYAIAVVNAVLLTTAFVLRLLGASTDASFTQWVYRSTERTMRPFRGIFPDRELGEASVLDTSLLFAGVVYVGAAVVIDGVLRWMGQKLREQQARTPPADPAGAAEALRPLPRERAPER
jgi:uncharacterized protein YggT (Ycf19 family)